VGWGHDRGCLPLVFRPPVGTPAPPLRGATHTQLLRIVARPATVCRELHSWCAQVPVGLMPADYKSLTLHQASRLGYRGGSMPPLPFPFRAHADNEQERVAVASRPGSPARGYP
jgi:hypothetical protein